MARNLTGKVCSLDWCDKPYEAKGYCAMHYQRSRKGQPLEPDTLDKKKPIQHGTLYAYQGRGCRCAECTDIASQFMRIQRGGTAPKLAVPRWGTAPSTNNRSKT